jgi:hypothetical protein
MELFARICTYFVFSRKVEYAARLRRAGVHWEYIRVCVFFIYHSIHVGIALHFYSCTRSSTRVLVLPL